MKLTLWTSFLIVLVFHAFSGVDAWVTRTVVQDFDNGALEERVSAFVGYCFDLSNGGVTVDFAEQQIKAFADGMNDQKIITTVEDLPAIGGFYQESNELTHACLTAPAGNAAVDISYAADNRLSEEEAPDYNIYSMKITGRDVDVATDFAAFNQKLKDAGVWDTVEDDIKLVIEFSDYYLLAYPHT